MPRALRITPDMQKRTAVSQGAHWQYRLDERALEAVALDALAFQFAATADGFSLLAGPALGRLFKGAAQLHFTEDAFTL